MFSNEFKLVDRECLLISNCFAAGLTSLRKANINNKGLFYNSFFHLSIAIERLCKLTLGISNYSLTGKFLTLQEMKNIGHDINKLLKEVQTKMPDDITPTNNSIVSQKIINLLNGFAKSTRYYNLDSLSGGVNLGNDPINEWINEIIPHGYNHIIEPNARLNSSIKRKVFRHAQVYNLFENSGLVSYLSIDGGGFVDNAIKSKMIDEITPYLIIEIANIAKPIVIYMDSVKKGLFLPDVREYFHYNVLLEDQFLLKCKRYKVLFTD